MVKTYKRWIPVIGKISMETKRVWCVALVTGVELGLHLKQFPAVAKLSKLIFNSTCILVVQRSKEIKIQFLREKFYRNIRIICLVGLTRNLFYVEKRPSGLISIVPHYVLVHLLPDVFPFPPVL